MENKKLRTFLILLAVTVVFSVLVIAVDKAPIGPHSTVVGFSHLNGALAKLIGTHMALYKITNILGYLAILVCLWFGFMGAMQLYNGKSLKKVDPNIIALGVLYVITIALYVIFEKVEINYRPIVMPGETLPEASFPSSHTMLALVVFGSAPSVLKRYIKDRNLMKAFTIGFYALAVITVVGRLLSGVHWFTDIIAGALISATLLAGFFYALDLIKEARRKNK